LNDWYRPGVVHVLDRKAIGGCIQFDAACSFAWPVQPQRGRP